MITLNCNTDRDPHGNNMAFCANWSDNEFRYHVWIGIRPYVEGECAAYPVKIGETIYKNTIADTRFANTKKLDINAAVHAKVKAEIKRLAKYDVLMALYNERKAAHVAFDAMHAEAGRLNRLFDAIIMIKNADVRELDMMNTHAMKGN